MPGTPGWKPGVPDQDLALLIFTVNLLQGPPAWEFHTCKRQLLPETSIYLWTSFGGWYNCRWINLTKRLGRSITMASSGVRPTEASTTTNISGRAI